LDRRTQQFLTIVDANKGIVYKVAYAYCNYTIDREDLIQEILIQLWLSLDKYDTRFKLSTWIYRVALNTSISFFRKNKTRKEKTFALTPALEIKLSETEKDSGESEVSRLEQMIQELSDIDKAIFLLYIDGITYKEISEIIGITSTNVSTKISRIKKSIKLKIKKSNT